MRTCTKCGIEQDESCFNRRMSRHGQPLYAACKKCMVAYGYRAAEKRVVEYVEGATKVCIRCGEEKALSLYNNNRFHKDGKYNYCRACNAKACSEYHKLKKSGEWTKKCNIERTHNLTMEDYNNLLAHQNGVCAICKQPETAVFKNTRGKETTVKDKLLAVDHCHTTGKIRGLLCSKCNTAIGLLKEDLNLVLAAGVYLEEYEKRECSRKLFDAEADM